MGVINMAHGEFIMAGAYTAYVMQQVIGDAGISLLVALPIGFVVGGLLGVILEATLIRRMYHRPLDTLLVTWGVSLILQQLARNIFGAPNVDVGAPGWLQGSIRIGRRRPGRRPGCSSSRSALAAVVALSAIIRFTSLGRRIRAVVQNRDLAETVGISTRATDRLTFFIGSGLAGVAGVALTLLGSTGPTLGHQLHRRRLPGRRGRRHRPDPRRGDRRLRPRPAAVGLPVHDDGEHGQGAAVRRHRRSSCSCGRRASSTSGPGASSRR